MTSALRDLKIGAVPNERELEGTESPEDNHNRHSSIEPHRHGRHDTSFPNYCLLEKPSSVTHIYSRSLLSLGNGVGMYNVVGNTSRPKEHLQLGAILGDVGYRDQDGDFNFLFNMFLPRNHAIQHGSFPENFTPLHPPPSDQDIVHIANYFKPGTIMTSEGVHVRRISESPMKVEFISSAPEAAVLVLPNGANREELVNTSSLLPYLKTYASSWYQHCNGGSDIINKPPMANGTLWVITGVDRSNSWAMATLPDHASHVGKRAQFLYKQETDESVWEDSGSKWEPEFQEQKLADSQLGAIFLRVMSVALGPDQWANHVAYVPPDSISHYGVLPTFSLGLRGWLHKVFSDRAGASPSSDGQAIFFHPSIILLHILLLTSPSADIGVVPDSIWISELSKRHLTHPEVVRLIRRVIDVYDIATTDGVATFVPKSEVAHLEAKKNDITSFIARIIPWISDSSQEKANIPLQNMVKVLGIR